MSTHIRIGELTVEGVLASLTTMVKECCGTSFLIIPPWLSHNNLLFNPSNYIFKDIPAMDTPNNEAVTAHQNDVLYGIEQTNKPLDEIANKPLDEIANKPLDENVSYSLDEIANKPLDEIVNKPLDENTNKPLNEIENKPLNEIANKPLDEIANKPLDEIENIPAVASNSLEDSEEELENEEENEVPEYTEEVVCE